MVIRQGDVFWAEAIISPGSGPAYRRPYVVVQNDLSNDSRIRTVIMCALTSNLKRAAVPGNVLLDAGEGNLAVQSVVNVSQVFTFDKAHLNEKIGSLSTKRMRQVIQGVTLMLEPREARG